MNDLELGKRFITGGEPELEEVISSYGAKLLRYATSILRNYHDAEDAVQQAFLLAYQNRTKFDGQNLSAWLHKITYNHSINKLKKHKVVFFSNFKSIPEESVNPYEEMSASDQTLQMLGLIKAEDRALLYGRIIDGQSYDELAQILGKSPAALRKQYERAKNKLATQLSTKPGFLERSPQNEYRYEQA